MACAVIERDCKRVAERRERGFELTWFCSRFWAPGGIIPDGTFIRPKPKFLGGARGANGFEYECTTAGQSGEKEPVWPTTLGATVQDGSVIWTCRALSTASLFRNIAAANDVTWSVPVGSTMSIEDDDIVNSDGAVQIVAFHEGGTDGTEVLVIAHVVFDNHSEEDFGILWTIHDAPPAAEA